MSEPQVPLESSYEFAGTPDCFQRLWTPYRQVYVNSLHDPNAAGDDCPFCSSPKKSDEYGLIVHRGATCFVVMNLYPYSTGHVLVCPYRHVGAYIELTPTETVEMSQLAQAAIRTLQQVSNPQGFNLGMNQGQVAGAGVAAHAHLHVVPRWSGDANFMPIIAGTRAIPQLLSTGRDLLAENWVGED